MENASIGNIQKVKDLLDQGVDPNFKYVGEKLSKEQEDALSDQLIDLESFYGNTPLFLAVRHGRSNEVIQQLLKAGADINAPSKDNQTVIDYVKTRLKEAGPDVDPESKKFAENVLTTLESAKA